MRFPIKYFFSLKPLLFYLCGIIVSMLKFYGSVKNSESQSFWLGFLKDMEYNKDFSNQIGHFNVRGEVPEFDFWLSVVFIATSPCLAS
jgi:hypothetical protein